MAEKRNFLSQFGNVIGLGTASERRKKLTKQLESGFSPRTNAVFSEGTSGEDAWSSYLTLWRRFFGFSFDPNRSQRLERPFHVTHRAIALTPNLSIARIEGSKHQIAALEGAGNSHLFYDFRFTKSADQETPEIRFFNWLQPLPMQATDTLVVIVSRAKLETYTGDLSHLCGKPLPLDENYCRIVADFFFQAFELLMKNDNPQIEVSITAAVVDLLLGLCDQLKSSSEQQRGNRLDLLREALRYIDGNFLDPEISPLSIAEAIGISPSYLYEIFSAQNISIADEIWSRRVSKAHDMLQDPALTEKSIAEVSHDCCFASQAHFSRRFKERFGIAPRAFRKTLMPQ